MKSLRHSLADPTHSALAEGYKDSEIYEIDLSRKKNLRQNKRRMNRNVSLFEPRHWEEQADGFYLPLIHNTQKHVTRVGQLEACDYGNDSAVVLKRQTDIDLGSESLFSNAKLQERSFTE